MKNVCNYDECLVLFVSLYNKIHTYEGSVSEKNYGEVSFYRVRCYKKLDDHADYVLCAKQGRQTLKCFDGFYFFSEC